MLLYHYSKDKHPTLMTLEKQRRITPDEIRQEEKKFVEHYKTAGYFPPGYYFEHISFFFEPPPLSEMSRIFPDTHPVWFKGNTLYEHVVETNDIHAFHYEVVEPPEQTDLYYNKKVDTEQYYKLLKQAIIDHRYIGKSNEELETVAQKFLGITQDYFKRIKSRDNYETIQHKYAATVPHVMLYPHLGKIKTQSITKVTVQ